METIGRVDVQKKLMSNLHDRATPFESRREKILYCESFYKSLGCEYGRHTGQRIPIQISSACRHFFHNNLQIGDVPKWARSDPDLLFKFIEVLRIYGTTKAKMKAKKATLENPRRLEIIPSEKREDFAHLLDGYDMTPEEEYEMKRRRSRAHLQAPDSQDQKQEDKCAQLRQMLAMVLSNNLLMANQVSVNPFQILVQNALKMTVDNNNVAIQPQAPLAVPTVSPSDEPSSPEEDKENLPERPSNIMEEILNRIKKTNSWKEEDEKLEG